MKWMPTCKETTELASRAMDKRLPIGDRIAMRMHLAICKNRMRFTQYSQKMRRLLQTETAANGLTPAPEARQRVVNELHNRLDS